jgi:hypothetical protein
MLLQVKAITNIKKIMYIYRFENNIFSAIGFYINFSKKNNLSISLFFSRFLNKKGFFLFVMISNSIK